MRTVLSAGASALAFGASGCNTLRDVANNPNCVSRVSGEVAFGSAWPTGKTRFSAVCNAAEKPDVKDVPSPAPIKDEAP